MCVLCVDGRFSQIQSHIDDQTHTQGNMLNLMLSDTECFMHSLAAKPHCNLAQLLLLINKKIDL